MGTHSITERDMENNLKKMCKGEGDFIVTMGVVIGSVVAVGINALLYLMYFIGGY